MVDEIVAVPGENLVHDEKLSKEEIRRLTGAAINLIQQGEKVKHADTGSDMVLFVGRNKDKIVDIQLQSGANIKQIFVTSLGDQEALQIRVNHQDEGYFKDDIEAFCKAKINPGNKKQIEGHYPRGLNSIPWGEKGTKADFARLTEILEETKIDGVLLEQTVQHDTASGTYVRTKVLEGHGGLRGLIGKGKRLLTG